MYTQCYRTPISIYSTIEKHILVDQLVSTQTMYTGEPSTANVLNAMFADGNDMPDEPY
jgi:hypothetical protein